MTDRILSIFRTAVALAAAALILRSCLGPAPDAHQAGSGDSALSKTDSGGDSMVIGIYGPGPVSNFPVIAAAGFNTIVAAADSEVLDAAAAAGLRVIAQPGTHAGEAFSATRAAGKVRDFDKHPALMAWYIVDEPAFNRISPDHVTAASESFRSAGAVKPLTQTLWFTDKAGFYIDAVDVLMVDRYPIPWMPLADLGHHIRMGKLAAGPHKPVWAVIQAFSWESYPDHMPRETGLRPPSYDEMRAMTFDAIAQGAEGVLFYAWKASSWDITTHPGVQVSVQIIVEELKRFMPVLLADRIWKPVQTRYADYPNRFNQRGFPAISTAFFHFEPGNPPPDFPDGVYLLAVNTTTLPHDYSIRVTAWPESENLITRDQSGQSVVPITNGWLSDHFDPLEVRVYGPLP